MKKNFLVFLLSVLIFSACSNDDDVAEIVEEPTPEEPAPEEPEAPEEVTYNREDYPIQDFIWSAMNVYYLYKADTPELDESYFSDVNEYAEYLSENPVPEDFYYDELVSDQDRFSYLTNDYVALENSFSGVSKSNGLKYSLVRFSNSNDIFGYVRYVAPNSNASTTIIERGDLFLTVDGTQMNINNYQSLLAQDDYTLGLATVANNTVSSTGESVELTKEEGFSENPILIAKTLEIDGQKIGYLMYNSYVGAYDDELNAAFADFKADGITDLVLDLRYNGGGSVASAIDLTSMITGQFEGEVITKQQWNAEAQAYFESQSPESLIDRFDGQIRTGEAINSLNLTRLYVIGTSSTASASELTIIGLRPYIDVKTIGTTTVGKFQASATLYDGDNFGKENINPDHNYAIQPLIYTYANANGVVGPPTGIVPDFELAEDLTNLGELGDENEPLLSLALDQILGRSHSSSKRNAGPAYELVGETDMNQPTFQKMYVTELPQIQK
ncbi:MAG: S41 family peptidase [Leeuwenhoekiella sp.]|jgi:C-terminal processing protease CtpA/Prc|uniref:S41 family peptidase n=1 Tax=Leeuwenhoekiella TaxID=283735 RepID=UPI000C5DFBD1|nr:MULTISPECIES: S41 family peptidase [Leeuwenhoekiella]MAO43107.1 peptidase S41 [Leeuwenhoekiella sp.]MAO45412.1 peptidase S41 [Leeuwenhoekiella sp.]MBQ52315.1 peptidase S41 [Leeuwenhoekiella sp.]|tara:strand:- start:532 stop:2031 length:1500 start_codon:yes stop_codon:yes gene_type:complete